MIVHVESNSDSATQFAAEWFADRLFRPDVKNVMVAGGYSPLALYELIANRGLHLDHLNIFALDEYVGVPANEPDNCANLLRRTVVDAWRVPGKQYYYL